MAFSLRAVAGSGPTDVWAVAEDGVLLHWDGASRKIRPADAPPAVFVNVAVTMPGDVWIVGPGVIRHVTAAGF